MVKQSSLVKIMIKAVLTAARNLRRDFGELEHLSIEKKKTADFVTSADRYAEKLIIEVLQETRPEFGILSEEREEIIGDGVHRWIVDPLDGTTNFMRGYHEFASAIALEIKGKVVASVIYNPVTDDLFWAESGKGAYHNDKRIYASKDRVMENAMIGTLPPFAGRKDDHFSTTLEKIMPKVSAVRMIGSAALTLAYTAKGSFNACWLKGLKPWDIAPGIPLLREAGCSITDLSGERDMVNKGEIIAAHRTLKIQLDDMIK